MHKRLRQSIRDFGDILHQCFIHDLLRYLITSKMDLAKISII
ncbi:MAG: hypothetical protein NT02SARS_1579 [SAR86 cluster bacterium SAR86B]|uniref:Uncharacterized protein n=1 Tax=SAR86 cluster bacterium SAR86B TaxID=1123867 RepID=J4V2L7_9GAMM|nr:MAG: hypothetical protein NT02SARS_1579 [SAR86 cluster bacterium SAR86B]